MFIGDARPESVQAVKVNKNIYKVFLVVVVFNVWNGGTTLTFETDTEFNDVAILNVAAGHV